MHLQEGVLQAVPRIVVIADEAAGDGAKFFLGAKLAFICSAYLRYCISQPLPLACLNPADLPTR